MCSQDVEALRAYGFEDESILEAVVVTAMAVYRCTLSLGLGPVPDFGPQKLAPTRIASLRDVALHIPSPRIHEAARNKGPYVPAPYLSSKTWTFCYRSEESRIHTELLPRSDVAARLAGSGAGSSGQDSAT
jgi:hypothetical protein